MNLTRCIIIATVLVACGEWNAAITCETSPNLPNGEIADGCKSGSLLFTTCPATCNNGYYIGGNEEVQCVYVPGSNDTNNVGEWNYGGTTCTAITCETSPNVLNGIIADGCGSGSLLNTTCTVTCNDGYYISGEEEVTCIDTPGSNDTNSEGEWDYGDTMCTAITCETSPNVLNGTVSNGCGSGSLVDTTCTVTCNDGYYISGDEKVTCIDTPGSDDTNSEGEWNYGGTMCTAITCEASPNVLNGTVSNGCGNGSLVDTTCTVTCNDGYYISGDEKVTCIDTPGSDDNNSEGEWNYGGTTCTLCTGPGKSYAWIAGIIVPIALIAITLIGYYFFGRPTLGSQKKSNGEKQADVIGLDKRYENVQPDEVYETVIYEDKYETVIDEDNIR